MFILITYDVNTETREGRRRLSKVAKACINYGHRVQNSVFECVITEAQYIVLKASIQSLIDVENDNVRFYLLGKNWEQHIEQIGKDTSLRINDPLII